MRRVELILASLFAAGLIQCNNEPPQYVFYDDLSTGDGLPLMPSVVPTFDDVVLAQRSARSGAPGVANGTGAPPPAAPPEPAPSEATEKGFPQPDTSDTAAPSAPPGPLSLPRRGGTEAQLPEDVPADMAVDAEPADAGGGSAASEPANASPGESPAEIPGGASENSTDDAPLSERAFAVLQRNCFRCHGDEPRIRSGLDLRTRESALQGGEHGPALVPGDPRQSRLFLQVTHQQKPFMPPKRTLDRASVQLIEAWIEAGAPWPGEEAAASESPTQSDGGAITNFLRRGVRAIREAPQRAR